MLGGSTSMQYVIYRTSKITILYAEVNAVADAEAELALEDAFRGLDCIENHLRDSKQISVLILPFLRAG